MKYPVQLKSALLPGLITTALVISGCGGGGSSDEDTEILSSTSSRGLITGFGSVYVNGVKYETDGAEIEVDDDASSGEDDLRVGMVVTVNGEIDDNGTTGHASSITYDNELKGPISAITPDADPTIKTLTVLGQQVVVNANTTFDDDHGFSFAGMLVGDVVEVSGFQTANGFIATHIEKQDDDGEIEITGKIADLTDTSFTIRGFNVSYDGTTEIDDDVTLANDLYVEVEGILDGVGTTLLAEEIEVEDEGKGEDMDEVEIQGVVSDYDPVTKTFNLGSITVDATNAELEPASLDLGGDPAPQVEVEGYWLDGVLIADEIEQKGRKIKIQAPLSAIGSETVTFSFNAQEIVVRVNHQTELEDDITDNDIVLTDLSAGDYVEMEAFNDGSDDINAIELKRKEAEDEIEIKAPLEGFDTATTTVTLLGIDFDLSAVSKFELNDDDSLSSAEFFAELTEGMFIELKDEDSNGVFDKVELED